MSEGAVLIPGLFFEGWYSGARCEAESATNLISSTAFLECLMTVIAAMSSTRSGSTWVGSDTLLLSGNLQLALRPKWIVSHNWAIGIAGHLRTMNVFVHHADDLLQQLPDAFEFTRRARDILNAEGFRTTKEEEGPPNFGQMLMLANPGNIWTIGPDFSITPLPGDTLWAEGSGRELAIGAAHALQPVAHRDFIPGNRPIGDRNGDHLRFAMRRNRMGHRAIGYDALRAENSSWNSKSSDFRQVLIQVNALDLLIARMSGSSRYRGGVRCWNGSQRLR